ncbi:MAG: zinc-dependent alcohol dehydrogenase [bacterium]
MPRELIAIAPRNPILREYDEKPLGPGEVRIKSSFSAEKFGTSFPIYRGISSVSEKKWDAELGLFMPKEHERGWSPTFPMNLGNMTVGTVVDVGEGVSRFKVGDRVFGYLPIRETHTVSEDRVELAPEGMAPEAIVYRDPAEFALAALRDGNVRLGDRVAVFGMGAIGLMAVQMARLSGASPVIAVDPLPNRQECARRCGADLVLDPSKVDAGYEIRMATGGKGADVAIEVSGSYSALHHAIRGVGFGGTVVVTSFYHGEAKGLRLGEEWHFNRINMVSSRNISDPNRDHPRWDSVRVRNTAFDLLREGKLKVEGLVDPIVPFSEVAEAYKFCDEHPEKSIKLGVTY